MRLTISLLCLTILLVSCKQPNAKLIVFPDKSGSVVLLVNGQPLKEYEFNPAGMYEADYRIYDSPSTELLLIDGPEVLTKDVAQTGTYLINLDRTYQISFEEISYGRYCNPCKEGRLNGVSITKIADNTLALPFKFNETPPTEISTKSKDTLSARQFFHLRAIGK